MAATVFVRIAVLAALTLAGCASAQDRAWPLNPSTPLGSDDYEEVLGRWTRSHKVYDVLDTVIFAHATFHTPEFRRAFMARHPNVFGPSSEEAGRLLLTRPDAEMDHEFFLSTFTSPTRLNDLERPQSIWRVTLQSDDHQPVPGAVQKLKPNANLRRFYPYVTDFARTYSLRFPLTTENGEPVITAQTRKLTVRITSALGEAHLVWRLQPSKLQ